MPEIFSVGSKVVGPAVKSLKERVGCSTLTFRHLPLMKALDRIAAREFRAVDIAVIPCNCCHLEPVAWTEKQSTELVEGLRVRKLRLSSLNVCTNGLPARNEDEPWEFSEKCLKIAKELGAYTVTISPGPSVERRIWLEIARRVAQRVRRLADVAESIGLRVSLEVPHLYMLAEDFAECARLFDIIDDPRVGCTFDTSHAQRAGRCALAEGIGRVGAEIVHVHLRDALWKNGELTPGKGSCDFLPFIQALEKGGYKGDFNLELEFRHATEGEVVEELAFAQSYLSLLLDRMPLPEEYAVWKSKLHQLKDVVVHSLRDPKGFVVSQPRLKRAVKPIAQLLLKVLPSRRKRYEVRWRRQWGMVGETRIRFVRGRRRSVSAQKVIQVGILGCGSVGNDMHAPGFARLPGVEVVGVCDKQPELADATARRIGCPAFYSLEDLVGQAKPVLVANCTKEWIHHHTSMYLLENGIDVFCEKIMAEQVAKGEAMVRCASEKGRVLGVNFNWRFLPGIVKIKEIKDSGGLGDLCFLRIFCHAWVWHHALDLASYLGGRIQSVSALLRQLPAHHDCGPWRRFGDEIPYLPTVCGMAMLETQSGVVANITSSELWNPKECLFNLDAVFRSGTIALSGIRMNDAVGSISSDRDDVRLRRGLVPRDGTSGFAITFQRSIEAFTSAYVKGQTPPSSGEDGLRAMQVERAIGQAAVLGQKVTV